MSKIIHKDQLTLTNHRCNDTLCPIKEIDGVAISCTSDCTFAVEKSYGDSGYKEIFRSDILTDVVRLYNILTLNPNMKKRLIGSTKKNSL